MTNQEIETAIRDEIRKAEQALARIDELATPEFRAAMSPDNLALGEAALKRANKALDLFHRIAGDVSAYFGGGK